MSTVFVGGSRRIPRLDDAVVARITNILKREFWIVVGDANGVDKCVQEFLARKAHRRVRVFHSGRNCRNNLGHWETCAIAADAPVRSYEFYVAKDREMARRADYGLMIWDTRSAGTLRNVVDLIQQHKTVVVYIAESGEFRNVCHQSDVEALLALCDRDLARRLIQKIGAAPREDPGQFTLELRESGDCMGVEAKRQ